MILPRPNITQDYPSKPRASGDDPEGFRLKVQELG